MKTEAKLKAAFIRELLQQCPTWRVLQYSTAGAPDREIVGDGVSTRWEFKHANPGYKSTGQQELFCARLAVVGHCRFVFWQETALGTERRTLIVHPKTVLEGKLDPEAWTRGFDHRWLVEQVRKTHQS